MGVETVFKSGDGLGTEKIFGNNLMNRSRQGQSNNYYYDRF